MLVFKLHARKGLSKEKFTGVFIDRDMQLLLTLASIGDGVSRSELIRRVIDDWFKNGNNEKSDLVKRIARRAYKIFQYTNKFEKGIDRLEFRKHLKIDLEKKKVPEAAVLSVLKQFDGLPKNK